MGLGKTIKKATGKVSGAVKKAVKNPLTYINPLTYAGTIGLKDLGVLDYGASQPNNPYSPGDWNRLFDNSKFDYLKDATAKAYDPAISESNQLFDQYINSIKSQGPVGESQFQDYISNINAPSSVDEARRSVENEQYQNALRDIGRQTESAIGSSKLDYQDRGLGGPGQMSDIEAVGLAQLRGQGAENEANARLSLYQQELDRLKAREEAARSAYGSRYQTGVASDMSKNQALQNAYGQKASVGTSLQSQKAGSDLDIKKYIADLISGRETSAVAGKTGQYSDAENRKYQYQKPSYFDQFMRGFLGSGGETFGEKIFK